MSKRAAGALLEIPCENASRGKGVGHETECAEIQASGRVGTVASLTSSAQCFSRSCFCYARAAPQPDLLWDSCSRVNVLKLPEQPGCASCDLTQLRQLSFVRSISESNLSELGLMESSSYTQLGACNFKTETSCKGATQIGASWEAGAGLRSFRLQQQDCQRLCCQLHLPIQAVFGGSEE